MPEMDGFEVIEAIGVERMPRVTFVTAYDQYTLRAFEVHALDYLLKPFDTCLIFSSVPQFPRAIVLPGAMRYYHALP
jgi:DNA-binding LytR/AlgR family response regulator